MAESLTLFRTSQCNRASREEKTHFSQYFPSDMLFQNDLAVGGYGSSLGEEDLQLSSNEHTQSPPYMHVSSVRRLLYWAHKVFRCISHARSLLFWAYAVFICISIVRRILYWAHTASICISHARNLLYWAHTVSMCISNARRLLCWAHTKSILLVNF